MKVSIVSLYDKNYRGIGEVTSQITSRYAAAHGYQFILHKELLDDRLSPSWNKLVAIKRVLNTCDWAIWLDADAVIVNQQRSVESVIATFSEIVSVAFSRDWNGLCMGVFLIKNDEWALHFINTLLFVGSLDQNKNRNYGEGEKFEQNSAKAILDHFPNLRTHICLVSENDILNPDTGFQPDPFIMHYWANSGSFNRINEKLNSLILNGWSPSAY